MPPASRSHRDCSETPEDTTPHMKAHIGANQVMGLNNSSIAEGAGAIEPRMATSDWTMSVSLN
jgi:hypothetical protein